VTSLLSFLAPPFSFASIRSALEISLKRPLWGLFAEVFETPDLFPFLPYPFIRTVFFPLASTCRISLNTPASPSLFFLGSFRNPPPEGELACKIFFPTLRPIVNQEYSFLPAVKKTSDPSSRTTLSLSLTTEVQPPPAFPLTSPPICSMITPRPLKCRRRLSGHFPFSYF